ncbi:MAG: hypothetical protein ACR2OZ_11845 [Verrucomicrobiales bacterium]
MISTVDKLRVSARRDSDPPTELSEPLRALWLCEAGRWHEAHEVAQEIDTPLGSWIHALLHLIEGDISNAGYWYNRAGKRPASATETAEEWDRIAEAALQPFDGR